MTTSDSQPAPMPARPTTARVTTDPDHAAPRPTILRWTDTAVGVAVAADEATSGLIAGLRRVADRRRQQVAGLADRGATERARWQQRAETTAQAAMARVATSPVIDRVVDNQLQRVLRPVVLAVLDDVLLLFEKEPERIQILIRGQRETMVDELVGRLRAGAEAGDTVVDRMTSRMFHRAPRAQPAPPLEL